MSRLTIAQRLWLGLGLILGLFALADFVSLGAANKVDVTLRTLVSTGDERRGAGYNMRSELAAMVLAVQAYLKERDPRQRIALDKSEKSFEQTLSSYSRLTSTERSQTLGREVTKAYAVLKRQGHEVLRLSDARARALDSLAAHQRKVDGLLNTMPVVAVPARQSHSVQRRAQVKELDSELRAAARDLDARTQAEGGRPESQMAYERERFATSLARYQRFAETPAERSWAESAGNWYAEMTRQNNAILAAEVVQRRSLGQFLAAARQLDESLVQSVQPAARAELAAAVEQASGIARETNILITRGLLLALVLGGLVALATVRAVRAPLAQLVASTRRVAEGDFSHRASWTSRDELGQLIAAFNEMAESLQSTTVSRGYLQSIVNSMGEALVVVSRSGIVQMANPAAEQLLGYQHGELTGKPLTSIVYAGTAAAGACEVKWPTRLTDQLIHREGFAIPVVISAVPLPMQADAGAAVVCIAQDLRERLEADQRQRQAAVVFENTREGIILTDAKRAIVLVNPAFREITGYETQEIEGMAVPQLWSNRGDGALTDTVWRTAQAQGQWQGEIWLRRKDGELRPVWKNVSAVRDAAGQISNFVAVFSDIGAIKEAEERLSFLAYYDALTHLPNRLLLADRLRLALDRAHQGVSVALLYLDLDEFKHVNDTLGHESGDLLLREMARRLPHSVRANDTVARLGGDEFIVVVEDVADAQQAAELAEKLLEAVAAPFELRDLELRMSASIGIALGPLHGSTSEDLLKAADAAMYRAKRIGGGNYQFFSAELTARAMEHLTLKNALRHPNLCDQLVLHYQPQVAVKTGRIVGVEALVRWQHPVRGLLSPGQFISIAEEAGLIHTIGAWVLQTACIQAKAWQHSGYAPLQIAVNVSAHEIRAHGIVDRIESILRETGFQASLLELEVTESALQLGDGVRQVLEGLKRLGVRLALDDFGTGYSSLGSIKTLPFDRLKIDRSFIRDLQHQTDDRSLTRAIINMGRSLKLEILAEGVETYGQFSFLRDEGCDEVQGYLLGHPMSAEDLDIRFPDRLVKLPSPELQLIKDKRGSSQPKEKARA